MISLFGSEQTGRPKKRKSGGQRRSVASPMEELIFSGVSSADNSFENENENRLDTEIVVAPVVQHEELPPEDEEGNVEYKV